MRNTLSLGAFLLVILLSTSLFASGVGITGIGARATALGGNYRAVSNDWSAMFWNPAGLTQIKGLHFGASFELISPEAKYTLTQNTPAFGVFKTAEFGNESKTFYIPAAGIVYGMDKMTFGLSIFAPFGLGSEWDAMNTADYHSQYPEYDYEDNLQIVDIHPTFAYQVNDKLSVGVGLSFVMADILIRKPQTTPNPLLFSPDYASMKPILSQTPLANDVYNYLLTESQLEGDGTGFGFNFGLKYDLNEDLSIGVSGSWYNDISIDGKIAATTYMPQTSNATDAAVDQTLDYLVSVNQIDAMTRAMIEGGISQIYNGAVVPTIPAGTAGDATLPLPMTLGAGIAYKGITNLLVTADVSWTQWSAWDVIEIDLENGEKSELVENWEDGIRLGLGFEYLITEPLKLRGGYYTEPSAIPDETLTIIIPDINRRHALSIGLSYDIGLFDIYASYETIILGDREVDKWVMNKAQDGFDNMAGLYKMTVNNFMFGLGYNF